MAGLNYKISWKDSESIDSLKLQMLFTSLSASHKYDLLDIYEDEVHTIAVVDGETSLVFLVFRLKFESNSLDQPLIQFIDNGNWYKPYSCDGYSIIIEYIDRVSHSSVDLDRFIAGDKFAYSTNIPVYDKEGIAMVFQCYEGFNVDTCILNNHIEISKGESEYEAKISPQELFGNKTALKFKLSTMGR